MRIIRLQAEGFKRLVAVDITPEGDLVELRGNNEQGKSSVLDAIFAALGGEKASPEKPVREGEEAAIIRLDLGEYVVTRYFTAEGTTSLKVTNPDGATFSKGQTTLNDLVGHISFDPLAFRDLPPEKQAEELRKLVDIVDPETGEPVDLGAIERDIKALFDERTIINRDGKAVSARVDGMAVAFVPENAPDKDALLAQMTKAAEHNAGIERARSQNAALARGIEISRADRDRCDRDIAEISQRLENLKEERALHERDIASGEERVANLEALPDPIDVAAVSAQLKECDGIEANKRHNAERDRLIAERDDLLAKSRAKTAKMRELHQRRATAIAAAKMPVEGLALQLVEDKLAVVYEGIPFSQASDAVRLRVSVGVAMAANPKLRIIRLKDASLLDKAAIEALRQMAADNSFQVWAEFVGDEGSGIIMEAGQVRGADTPEPMERPRKRKPKEDGGDAAPATETENAPETSTAEEKTGAATPDASKNDAPSAKPGSPSTLFERMEGATTPSKPRAMRSFSTKPATN